MITAAVGCDRYFVYIERDWSSSGKQLRSREVLPGVTFTSAGSIGHRGDHHLGMAFDVVNSSESPVALRRARIAGRAGSHDSIEENGLGAVQVVAPRSAGQFMTTWDLQDEVVNALGQEAVLELTLDTGGSQRQITIRYQRQ